MSHPMVRGPAKRPGALIPVGAPWDSRWLAGLGFLLALCAPLQAAVVNVVDVTAITGQRVVGPLTSWQTRDGTYTVEHLAGRSPAGDLLVFYNVSLTPLKPEWRVVNVTQITGQRVTGPVTSWLVGDVEHLAGRSPAGDLLVFYWSPRHDWQSVNVSQKTGQKIESPVTNWQTPNGPSLVEHLAGPGPDQALRVFWWTPATDWRVVNASQIAGEAAAGVPAAYQVQEGAENVELLGTRSPDGSLLLYWWKPSRDWQVLNVSEITGQPIASDPQAWLARFGNQTVERIAAEGTRQRLLVFWGFPQPRSLTDALGRPFQSLKWIHGIRRNVAAILWDPHRPTDPAPTRAAVQATIFGAMNSVRDYFLENSGGAFTIDSAGVLGWYAADKPWQHYWGPLDPGDADGDGWINGHVEKWAEAIRKASADFNFAAFDANGDGNLSPDELGILVVIPQNSPFGTNRDAVGREYPTPLPLVVDGVRVSRIAEVYIGNPPNLGVVAHELSHLLLGHGDMYFNFFQPFAAGDYSLMDRTYKTTHLDPFAKLKCGWLRPKVIFRSGRYTLADVETRHAVWVLMDPRRGPDEYFIVENRWSGSSYDRQMADRGGLAVWHIMENPAVYGSVPPPPGVSSADWASVGAGDWSRRAIQMIRPILTPPFDDSQALWDGAEPATGYDLRSVDPDPRHATLRWADGTPSGFALRALSPAGPEMSATVEVPF